MHTEADGDIVQSIRMQICRMKAELISAFVAAQNEQVWCWRAPINAEARGPCMRSWRVDWLGVVMGWGSIVVSAPAQEAAHKK